MTAIHNSVRLLKAKPDAGVLRVFATALNTIWRGGGSRPRLGLAISGGVDSMALASLCHEATLPEGELRGYPTTSTSFTAFIVDHKLRANSDVEAGHVAVELQRLGIESRILELDWHSYGDPSSLRNVESLARTLRYQALGRACREAGINSLLLAHHADDQAETVMTRLLSNYVGIGLGGINFIAEIPECDGIYGVDQSGGLRTDVTQQVRKLRHTMSYEKGGVRVARPLLALSKGQLVRTCKQTGVRWFEDHTNADPQLTLRNTVRYLNTSEALPVALRKSRLSALASKLSNERNDVEASAQASMSDMLVPLDLSSGQARFLVQNQPPNLTPANNRFYATLLRKMLEPVTPKDTIALQHLDNAVDFMFRSHDLEEHRPNHNVKKQIQIAGVCVRPERDAKDMSLGRSGMVFMMHRSVPTNGERTKCVTVFQLPVLRRNDTEQSRWSAWYLWDGRYWIRVRPPESADTGLLEVVVRFLTFNNLAALRNRIPKKAALHLDQALSHAKGDIRFTIPAIGIRHRGDSAEEIVALPSVKWSVSGWRRDSGRPCEDSWLWDIRFKHVGLNLRGKHSVTS